MSFVVDERVEAYAEAHTTPPAAFMDALADETRATLESPQMLTGPVEGRLLETLVFATQPRLVLEIGTYSGYSALFMAAALPPGGRVITLELDDERADFAQRHIDASPYADRIEIRRGPALDSIAALDGPFDLVFIDADKAGYPAYLDAVLPKLADHGLIVGDNTLRNGSVLDPGDDVDANLAGTLEFNARAASDPDLIAVMLTVRDGVTLIRKA